MGSLDQLHPDRLSAYLTAIDDLEHEGDQLHRRVRAQLYDFTEEHPAQNVLRWKDVTDGIEHALDELPTSPTPWKGSSSNTPNRSWRCGRPAPALLRGDQALVSLSSGAANR